MRKIKEILRLKWETNLSNRQIAKSVNTSHTTISEIINRAKKANLTWPLPEEMDEDRLNSILYPKKIADKKPLPDTRYIHNELKRKSVTLQLLWEEYLANNPNGYSYSYFCELYHSWRKTLDLPLRQIHKAGEKMFLDFAGQTVKIWDPLERKFHDAHIFIATLGASNYTFARATLSCNLENWILLNCLAFEFFAGVTEILVPDNLKTAVTKACRYEPDLNPTYLEMAEYYGCAIIPARPYRPRDKSKAENAVLHTERQILARLRNCTFLDIDELNKAIEELLVDLNKKPFQKLKGSRSVLYETLEKSLLKPLPEKRFECGYWKRLQVNIDYHVELEKNYYSIPFQLVKEKVDVRYSVSIVEIFHKGKRVTSHLKAKGQGKTITNPEHMPPSHRQHLEWTPSKIISWAEEAGSSIAELVKKIVAVKAHPEQGYRSCLGILRLERKYGKDRLESACKRALHYEALSYKSVKSILEKKLDLAPQEETISLLVEHKNIRGALYYGAEEEASC